MFLIIRKAYIKKGRVITVYNAGAKFEPAILLQ